MGNTNLNHSQLNRCGSYSNFTQPQNKNIFSNYPPEQSYQNSSGFSSQEYKKRNDYIGNKGDLEDRAIQKMVSSEVPVDEGARLAYEQKRSGVAKRQQEREAFSETSTFYDLQR